MEIASRSAFGSWGPSSTPALATNSLSNIFTMDPTKKVDWNDLYLQTSGHDIGVGKKLGIVDDKLSDFKEEGYVQASKEFQSRFNMTDTLRATEDMIETIDNPSGKLKLVQKEIELISREMAVQWSKSYQEYLQLGDVPLVASSRADQAVLPLLKERMKVLKIRYPYSFRAEGALNELLLRSEQIMQNGRFIRPKVMSNLPAIGQ